MSSIFEEKAMKRTIFIFGAIAICVFVLFEISTYSLTSRRMGFDQYLSTELIVAVVGCLLILVGFFVHRLISSKEDPHSIDSRVDPAQIEQYGISNRQYEILQLMAKGLSNAEIGEQLHISENTVKTHVSSILSKLNARRRTEAVRIARECNILPS